MNNVPNELLNSPGLSKNSCLHMPMIQAFQDTPAQSIAAVRYLSYHRLASRASTRLASLQLHIAF